MILSSMWDRGLTIKILPIYLFLLKKNFNKTYFITGKRLIFVRTMSSKLLLNLRRYNLWPGSHWYRRRWYNFFGSIAITDGRNHRHDEDFKSCKDGGHNERD